MRLQGTGVRGNGMMSAASVSTRVIFRSRKNAVGNEKSRRRNEGIEEVSDNR